MLNGCRLWQTRLPSSAKALPVFLTKLKCFLLSAVKRFRFRLRQMSVDLAEKTGIRCPERLRFVFAPRSPDGERFLDRRILIDPEASFRIRPTVAVAFFDTASGLR